MIEKMQSPILLTAPALFHPQGGILGGAERYVYEFAKNLADREPTRLLTFGKPDLFREGKLEIKVIQGRKVRGQEFNPFSLSLLSEMRDARLIHCFQKHIVASSFLAAMGRVIGKPVFVTDLGGGGWDISAYISTNGWFKGELHISEYSKSLGETQPSTVVGGGVDTEKFYPDSTIERKEFLFVGRLFPHKGVDTLIEAATRDTPVHILGTAPDSKYLNHLRALAQDKPVRFTFAASDEQLHHSYCASKAIVLPSRKVDCYGNRTEVPELLGQTLLEGMACETPAIGSRVASIPEIIDHGESGFLFDEGNSDQLREKLLALLEDTKVTEMGRAARSRIEAKFLWDTVISRSLNAYGLGGSN